MASQKNTVTLYGINLDELDRNAHKVNGSGCRPLFDLSKLSDHCLEFTKNCNLFYGRNGTGKSTLSRYLKSHADNATPFLFCGYENILGDNNKLNAIALGEDNTKIDKQISDIDKQIASLEEQITVEQIKIDGENTSMGEENLNSQEQKVQDDINKINKKIQKFYTTSASTINTQNPPLYIGTYNARNIKDEIDSALSSGSLGDSQRKNLEDILSAQVMHVDHVDWSSFSFSNLLEQVNRIIQWKPREVISIERLSDNSEKVNFAKTGLNIHHPGDTCAFCGNRVSEATYAELEKYFSANDLKDLQNAIKTSKNSLIPIKNSLSSLNLNADNFYPDKKTQELYDLLQSFHTRQSEILTRIDDMVSALEKKSEELFTVFPELTFSIPQDINILIEKFNTFADANNANNLEQSQEDARKSLRFAKIKELVENSSYNDDTKNRDEYGKTLQDIEQKKKDIEARINSIREKIEEKHREISNLQSRTQNVALLAHIINEKLNVYANFQLELINDDDTSQGYYQVKDKNTHETRDISELSTGEHNIIAFLYFIEQIINKINLKEVPSSRRLIIFDDPMTSNDDLYQYLIIEELTKLQDLLARNKLNDILIILTHNKHFYLNLIPYAYKDKQTFDYFHLESSGTFTQITPVTPKNDFKTSYDELWHSLHFLNTLNDPSNCHVHLMLNTVRRIIDTYTKFNNIKNHVFYSPVPGAQKLFNVNSHEIDINSTPTDVNTLTAHEIIETLRQCFEKNNASEHFKVHWPESTNTQD